uniref:Olfactory receptor n=1 Tax=Scleropages formosus TaxID=113540 RepID=A0A8C9V028_SCLFO
MENYSELVFVLHGLNETRKNKQIIFSFSFIGYLLSIFFNITVIVAILLEKVLHEPMHIFLCSLCFNGICGATGFYPYFLNSLSLDSNVITYRACIAQIFLIYTYIFCEFTNLTMMAYDRYAAICRPLEYHSIMTPLKIGKLLIFTWLFSLSETFAGVVLTVRLPLCGNSIDKLYCFNWDIVKLSCTDTSLNNFYGYILLFFQISQAIMVIISYIHITRTCFRSRTEQSKFMETCVPHLITLSTFSLSVCLDVVSARFSSSESLQTFRNILSVKYLVIPPLLNPLLYGLKLKQIRRSVWKILCCS